MINLQTAMDAQNIFVKSFEKIILSSCKTSKNDKYAMLCGCEIKKCFNIDCENVVEPRSKLVVIKYVCDVDVGNCKFKNRSLVSFGGESRYTSRISITNMKDLLSIDYLFQKYNCQLKNRFDTKFCSVLCLDVCCDL